MDEFSEFVWGELVWSCSDFGCGAPVALGSTVFGFLATVFGVMASDFAVEALVILHELCFLFFRVIGGADSIDIYVDSTLGGGVFPFILSTLLVDSKGSVESVVVPVLMGNLLLPFAMQSDHFLGPSFKVPRVLGQGVVFICVDDGIKERFL